MTVVDLSHPIHPAMPVYPGDPAPALTPWAELGRHGFRSSRFCLGSHTGTHIDAPAHLLADGRGLDSFAAAQLLGPAVTVDCRGLAGGAIDLARLRADQDRLRGAEFVLLHSGWDARWGTAAYFAGFPVLTPEAAHWLTGLGLKGIGVDAPSLDRGDDPDLGNHRLLLGRDILLIENLTRLEQLPSAPCRLSALPLPIVGLDAAPARVIAEW